MGMMIDNSCEPKSMSKEEIVDTLKTMVFGVQSFDRFNAKERETIDKAWNLIDQYENRLKADIVAMLTDIQLEIEETVKEEELIDKTWANGLHYSEKIIQQKIDALKEKEFRCEAKESGWYAYNCNDCSNKCEEWYQWGKEMNAGRLAH